MSKKKPEERPSSDCPGRAELTAFTLGKLPEDVLLAIARRLEECPHCREHLESLGDVTDGLLDTLREPPKEAGKFLDESSCRKMLRRVDAIGLSLSQVEGGGKALDAGELEEGEPRELGQYRILGKVGEGGMGTVYRALHKQLEKLVALKVLPPERMQDDQAVARFSREMRAVGKLDHPNIVRATDAGEIEGTHFLVMELVQGASLHELLKARGKLPVADACELIRQAAVGLEYAHGHKLVHRDIKPSNLLLERGGKVKILDLGLARLHSEREGTVDITTTGLVMGTADYMSPEQAGDPHTVDHRADIYSLGCTLYKLLAGRAPYEGPQYDSAIKKLMAHTSAPVPPLKKLRPQVPKALVNVVGRMLAKDPLARYPNAKAVAKALEPFVTGENLAALLEPEKQEEPAAPVKKPAKTRENKAKSPVPLRVPGWARWAAAAVALLACAYLLIPWGGPSVEDGGSPLAPEPPGKETAKATRIPVETTPPVSRLALVTTPEKIADDVKSWTIETVGHRGGHWGVGSMSFSPDDTKLATVGADATVRIWDVATGQLDQVLVGHEGTTTTVGWSPYGKYLASGSRDRTVRIWEVGSWKLAARPIPEETKATSDGLVGVNRVAWSPKRDLLAVATETQLSIYDISDPASPTLEERESHARSRNENDLLEQSGGKFQKVTWSPDGKTVATSGAFGVFLFRHQRGSWMEEKLDVGGRDHWPWEIVFSPRDGKGLLACLSRQGLKLVELDSASEPRDLPSPIAGQPGVSYGAFSGDGSVFAGRVGGNQQMGRQVCMWNVDSLEPSLLPEKGIFDLALSHNGKILATVGGSLQLWAANRLGVWETEHVIPFHPVQMREVAWASKGQKLVCAYDSFPLSWQIARPARSGRQDGRLREWDAWFRYDGGHRVIDLSSASASVPIYHASGFGERSYNGLYCFADSRYCVSGLARLSPQVLDMERGRALLSLAGPEGVGALSGHGKYVAFPRDKTLVVVDTSTGRIVDEHSYDGRASHGADEVHFDALAFSHSDGASLAFAQGVKRKGTWTSMLYHWTPGNGRPVALGCREQLSTLAWSPDGDYLAAGRQYDGPARVWVYERVGNQMELLPTSGSYTGVIRHLMWKDATTLALSDVNGQVSSWKPALGAAEEPVPQARIEYPQHVPPIIPNVTKAGIFSPRATRLAAPNLNTARIWDPNTGNSLGTFACLSAHQYLALSPDGHMSASESVEANLEQEVVYVVQHNDGTQRTLKPSKFFERYRTNDPNGVNLLGGTGARRKPSPPKPEFAEPLTPTSFVQSPKKLDGVKSWTIETKAPRGGELNVATVESNCDGTRLAAIGVDARIRIWDSSGVLKQILKGHYPVRFDTTATTLNRWGTLAWCPLEEKKQLLASGGDDKVVCIWDTETGECLQSLRGHPYPVTELAWSPDGVRLAVGCRFVLYLWDLSTDPLIASQSALAQAGNNEYWHVAWSSAGLLVSGGDKVLRPLDPDGLKTTSGWDPEGTVQKDHVFGIDFHPGGKRLACAYKSKGVWVYNTEKNPWEGAPLPGSEGRMFRAPTWSGNGTKLAALGEEEPHPRLLAANFSRLYVWDTSTEPPTLSVKPWIDKTEVGHVSYRWTTCAWAAEDTRIVTGGPGMRFWTSETLERVDVDLPSCSAQASGLCWAGEGGSLVVSYSGGSAPGIVSWSPREGSARVVVPDGGPIGVSVSPSGRVVAGFRDTDHELYLWDMERGSELKVDLRAAYSMPAFAWSKDGKRLAIGSGKRVASLRITDCEKGEVILRDELGIKVKSLAWSPDGTRLAIARGDEPHVEIYDPAAAEGERCLVQLQGRRLPAEALLWVDDGGHLAASYSKDTIVIWDAINGTQRGRPLKGHPDTIHSLALSPDGEVLIGADGRGNVFYFDWRARQLAATSAGRIFPDAKEPFKDAPPYPTLSPDGSILAWKCHQDIHLWDPAKNTPLGALVLLDAGRHVLVSRDGHFKGSDERVKDEIVYIVETEDGQQQTLTPDPFSADYFANDSTRVAVRLSTAHDRQASQPREEDLEWKPLFNGNDRTGWVPEDSPNFKVEKGILVGRPGPDGQGGHLCTVDEYADFECEVTWKMEWPGNSGIWFRYTNETKAYQADILENTNPVCFSGSLYNAGHVHAARRGDFGKSLPALNEDPSTVDRGGWNTFLIRAQGDHIEIFLNGRKVVDHRDNSYARGKFGIQVSDVTEAGGGVIRIADIRVRSLAKD